jgi:hypothetical protein
MSEQSNEIAYVIVQVGEHIKMHYMPELLDEKNLEVWLGYGVSLENSDSDDMVNFKLLTFKILREFYKLKFNIK